METIEKNVETVRDEASGQHHLFDAPEDDGTRGHGIRRHCPVEACYP